MPTITPHLSLTSPSPLTTFLLTYQQLQNVSSSLLFQLQAWQTGTGSVSTGVQTFEKYLSFQMSVINVGHSVHALALTAEISASLASLLSWLFISMSRHVEPSALDTLMPPHRHSEGDHFGGSGVRDESDDEFTDAEERSHISGRRSSEHDTGGSRKRSTDTETAPVQSQLPVDSKKRRTSSDEEDDVPSEFLRNKTDEDIGSEDIEMINPDTTVLLAGSSNTSRDRPRVEQQSINPFELLAGNIVFVYPSWPFFIQGLTRIHWQV